VNDPSELIAGFEAKHLEMIKAMRGVPGVLPERFAEVRSYTPYPYPYP